MSDRPDFIPTDFSEFDQYIRQGEPDQKERAANWAIAIGLQAVDGLKVSDFLRQTALENIEGKITINEAQKIVSSYYTTQENRDINTEGTEEADRIQKVCSIPTMRT